MIKQSIKNRETTEYYESLLKESDRGSVVLVGTRLDDVLEELHTKHIQRTILPRQLTNEFSQQWFRGFGPLASFSQKIKIAYAYGLIGCEIYQDLEVVRSLRNKAAHKLTFSFGAQSVRDELARLRAVQRASTDKQQKDRLSLDATPLSIWVGQAMALELEI